MQIRACNTEKCMENYILYSAAVCSCRKDKVLFCHTKTAAARKITSQNVYALHVTYLSPYYIL